MAADVRYWFDPVCPFCWITSRWVKQVVELRPMSIEWRFISLRIINDERDYENEFPSHYERSHAGGLRLLRVCAAARDAHGADVVGPLYSAIGEAYWEVEQEEARERREEVAWGDGVTDALAAAGLPTELAAAADDESWDDVISRESDEALSLTGRDVGTPIIQIGPPDGLAFFGPVISRIPTPERALELWDHVVGLTKFPGFAELKRSLRERPQVRTDSTEPGVVEDWQAGRVRS